MTIEQRTVHGPLHILEQRLHAEPVAREEQFALLLIVNRKGEHAVELLKASGPPLTPGGEDRLAVALGAETVPACLKFSP